ncbi:Proline-rich receptor-like protein kinase PERK12, partial [Bienertia sinuspersici]
YASFGRLTNKSDVYSFYVMLAKMITGRRPVDRTQKGYNLVERWQPLQKGLIGFDGKDMGHSTSEYGGTTSEYGLYAYISSSEDQTTRELDTDEVQKERRRFQQHF